MKIRRRFVTLVEMMIVMFLIALITGVVAYNYRSSLDRGRVFASEQGVERLQQILEIAVAERPELIDQVATRWQDIARTSPLFNERLLQDGWGNTYSVQVMEGRIQVSSPGLDTYRQEHPNPQH